jgi:hypothetical protein
MRKALSSIGKPITRQQVIELGEDMICGTDNEVREEMVQWVHESF